MNEAVAQAQLDALAMRVRGRSPAPGSEATLRSYIRALQRGQLNLEDWVPAARAAIRPQGPAVTARFANLGQLKSLTFKGVTQNGWDLYESRFEKTSFEWTISLAPDGKIELLIFQPII